jgi:hypothetical protein
MFFMVIKFESEKFIPFLEVWLLRSGQRHLSGSFDDALILYQTLAVLQPSVCFHGMA